MTRMTGYAKRTLLAVCALTIVGACAGAARPDRMVPELSDADAAAHNTPLSGGIAVMTVGGGEETNPWATSKVASEDLQEALRLSLSQHGFLAPDRAGAPYRLSAFLIDLKQPGGGYTLTVDSVVRYVLEKRDGDVVFDDLVTASYKANFSESVIAIERLRLANEGSIKANIGRFLESLRKLGAEPGSASLISVGVRRAVA